MIDRCLILIFIRNIYLYILLIIVIDVYMWLVVDKLVVSIEYIVLKCYYVWSEIFLSEIKCLMDEIIDKRKKKFMN